MQTFFVLCRWSFGVFLWELFTLGKVIDDELRIRLTSEVHRLDLLWNRPISLHHYLFLKYELRMLNSCFTALILHSTQ